MVQTTNFMYLFPRQIKLDISCDNSYQNLVVFLFVFKEKINIISTFIPPIVLFWKCCLHYVCAYIFNSLQIIFMPPKELWEAYSNRTVRLSFRSSVRPSVRPALCPVHISLILWGRNSKFGVWIHLGMAECLVPFLVTVTLNLTSDLVFRIIVSGAYPLYYLR